MSDKKTNTNENMLQTWSETQQHLLADWLDTFAESFLAAVPTQQRGAVKDAVEAALRPTLWDGKGVWTVDYVRLRFASVKPMQGAP